MPPHLLRGDVEQRGSALRAPQLTVDAGLPRPVLARHVVGGDAKAGQLGHLVLRLQPATGCPGPARPPTHLDEADQRRHDHGDPAPLLHHRRQLVTQGLAPASGHCKGNMRSDRVLR